MFFRKLFSGLGGGSSPKVPHGKPGARAYAVGDVHGCLVQLNRLIARIEADLDERPVKEAFLVFVGDLIDRGPDSAGVIERLRTYSPPGAAFSTTGSITAASNAPRAMESRPISS